MEFISIFNSLHTKIEKLRLIENLDTIYDQYTPESVEAGLLEIVQHDENPVIRHEAAFHLGKLNSTLTFNEKKIIEIFEHVLNSDRSIVVKHEVLEALGFLDSPESIALLTRYSQHSDPDISTSADLSLNRISLRTKQSA